MWNQPLVLFPLPMLVLLYFPVFEKLNISPPQTGKNRRMIFVSTMDETSSVDMKEPTAYRVFVAAANCCSCRR